VFFLNEAFFEWTEQDGGGGSDFWTEAGNVQFATSSLTQEDGCKSTFEAIIRRKKFVKSILETCPVCVQFVIWLPTLIAICNITCRERGILEPLQFPAFIVTADLLRKRSKWRI